MFTFKCLYHLDFIFMLDSEVKMQNYSFIFQVASELCQHRK